MPYLEDLGLEGELLVRWDVESDGRVRFDLVESVSTSFGTGGNAAGFQLGIGAGGTNGG